MTKEALKSSSARLQEFRENLSQTPLDKINLTLELLKLHFLFPVAGYHDLLDGILGSEQPYSQSVELFHSTKTRLEFLQSLRRRGEDTSEDELFPY